MADNAKTLVVDLFKVIGDISVRVTAVLRDVDEMADHVKGIVYAPGSEVDPHTLVTKVGVINGINTEVKGKSDTCLDYILLGLEITAYVRAVRKIMWEQDVGGNLKVYETNRTMEKQLPESSNVSGMIDGKFRSEDDKDVIAVNKILSTFNTKRLEVAAEKMQSLSWMLKGFRLNSSNVMEELEKASQVSGNEELHREVFHWATAATKRHHEGKLAMDAVLEALPVFDRVIF